MTAAALSALLAHWRRHPVQLAMLLAGLALATALWSGVQALNAEARAAYDRAGALLGEAELRAAGGARRDGRPSPTTSPCAAPAGRSRPSSRGAPSWARPASRFWASTR
jgi:hypothetical protein